MDDYWERDCNNEEVPSLDCVDMCCGDCNFKGCMYFCSDWDENDGCKRFS